MPQPMPVSRSEQQGLAPPMPPQQRRIGRAAPEVQDGVRFSDRYLECVTLQSRLRSGAASDAIGPGVVVDTDWVMRALAPVLGRTDRSGAQPPAADRHPPVRRALSPMPGGRLLAVDVVPAVIAFDANDLARLVQELVDNGRRHATTGATVRLRGAPGARGYQLSVTNPGERLPRWVLASLRDDLATPASADPAGLALGLPIAAALARLNGARLEVLRGAGRPNTLRVVARTG
jgi:signal transduction histidine kinase